MKALALKDERLHQRYKVFCAEEGIPMGVMTEHLLETAIRLRLLPTYVQQLHTIREQLDIADPMLVPYIITILTGLQDNGESSELR